DGASAERRAEPGEAVLVQEAADLEVRERLDVDEPATVPEELVRLHPDLDRPERQGVATAREVERRAVLRAEGADQRAVVDLGRDARPVVEAARRGVGSLGEEERPRIDRGSEMIRAAALLFSVDQRELGEREDVAATAPAVGDDLVELCDRSGRIVVEAIEESLRAERRARHLARLAGRERALGARDVRVVRVEGPHADR